MVPRDDRGIHTDWKHDVEMGSGAMKYTSRFISLVQPFKNRGDAQTHRQHGDRINLLLFIQYMESWLTKQSERTGTAPLRLHSLKMKFILI
jgi:hypothetical protein